MSASQLQRVAEEIVRLASGQGFVVEREVRQELARVNLSESLWKDVLALCQPALRYRRGRYYSNAPAGDSPLAPALRQQSIHAVVDQLVEQYQHSVQEVERREHGRRDFIQAVEVVTEDGRRYTLLSRDISTTGIRLIGTRRFLGQKVRVVVPSSTGTITFTVHILWTCPVGEDLVENGGIFLDVQRNDRPPPLEGDTHTR